MVSGLTMEGIYRLCGQQSVITRLLSSVATGELFTYIRFYSPFRKKHTNKQTTKNRKETEKNT